MNCVVVLIIYLFSLCEANNLVCQYFDVNLGSFEKYCENYNGSHPNNCSNQMLVKLSYVTQLKVAGCDSRTVATTVKDFTNVHHLDISYSKYKSLDWFEALDLNQLVKLNASHNEISNAVCFLNHAPEVMEIDLSHNKMTHIDCSTFMGLYKLKKIHLAHNALETITNGALDDVISLEYIDLSNNNLQRMLLIFNLNKNQWWKTVHLHVEKNPISGYSCFYASKSPVAVYLSWKPVKWYYENAWYRKGAQLRVVRNDQNEGVFPTTEGDYELHCNEWSFVNLQRFKIGPSTFKNVTDIMPFLGPSIQEIDLFGNFVGKLNPITFERLIYLKSLILKDTMLTEFDFSVLRNQIDLLELDISNNNLKYLSNVSYLRVLHLIQLDMAGNQVVNTPEMFKYLNPSLEKLELTENFVGSLNATTFERLIGLEKLNLSNTALAIDHINPFQSLRRLKSLDISQNSLTNVDFSVLRPTLIKLRHFVAADCHIKNASGVIRHLGAGVKILDLSGNDFGTFNDRTFEHLIHLEHLKLNNAKLRYFDFRSLQYPQHLRLLDIARNELQKIDFQNVPITLKRINIEENQLTEVDMLPRSHFSSPLEVAIARNQFPCAYLKRIIRDYKRIEFVGDHWNQKVDRDCRSTTQGIDDFLTSVYNKFKIW